MNSILKMGRKVRATLRKTRRSPKANGFTLMELLIVISIILILMLMAIPTATMVRKKANETNAIVSLKSIYTMQTTYNQYYPNLGFATTVAALGGDPKAGPPSATAAQLLPVDLASGVKNGYVFAITNVVKKNAGGNDIVTGYTITATPLTVGQTGDRGFCEDSSGSVTFDAAGGTNCTQPLQ